MPGADRPPQRLKLVFNVDKHKEATNKKAKKEPSSKKQGGPPKKKTKVEAKVPTATTLDHSATTPRSLAAFPTPTSSQAVALVHYGPLDVTSGHVATTARMKSGLSILSIKSKVWGDLAAETDFNAPLWRSNLTSLVNWTMNNMATGVAYDHISDQLETRNASKSHVQDVRRAVNQAVMGRLSDMMVGVSNEFARDGRNDPDGIERSLESLHPLIDDMLSHNIDRPHYPHLSALLAPESLVRFNQSDKTNADFLNLVQAVQIAFTELDASTYRGGSQNYAALDRKNMRKKSFDQAISTRATVKCVHIRMALIEEIVESEWRKLDGLGVTDYPAAAVSHADNALQLKVLEKLEADCEKCA